MKLIGQKVGMTHIFDDTGVEIPVTLVEIKGNKVVGLRTREKNGYDAVQIGYGVNKKDKRKAMVKAYGEGKVPQLVREFRGGGDSFKSGNELTVSLFEGVDYVDVQGVSIGKGFQGVVRKFGMSGGPDTHGSKFHRHPGSIGNRSFPGRIWKGKKLPGRMGGKTVTVQNLKLVKIDVENNILLVRGAVPGPDRGLVSVKKAVKK